jgi:hypothetical protein
VSGVSDLEERNESAAGETNAIVAAERNESEATEKSESVVSEKTESDAARQRESEVTRKSKSDVTRKRKSKGTRKRESGATRKRESEALRESEAMRKNEKEATRGSDRLVPAVDLSHWSLVGMESQVSARQAGERRPRNVDRAVVQRPVEVAAKEAEVGPPVIRVSLVRFVPPQTDFASIGELDMDEVRRLLEERERAVVFSEPRGGRAQKKKSEERIRVTRKGLERPRKWWG